MAIYDAAAAAREIADTSADPGDWALLRALEAVETCEDREARRR